MDITPIKTEADYDAALAEIDRLMDAVPNTPRGDRFDVLVTLNRKRPLSIEMMRRLHATLDIPAESFMRPVKRSRSSTGKRP